MLVRQVCGVAVPAKNILNTIISPDPDENISENQVIAQISSMGGVSQYSTLVGSSEMEKFLNGPVGRQASLPSNLRFYDYKETIETDEQFKTIQSTPGSNAALDNHEELESVLRRTGFYDKREAVETDSVPEVSRALLRGSNSRKLQGTKLPTNWGDEFTITRSNVLGRVVIPDNFVVEFDLFPVPQSQNDWRNIMHMTQGGDCCYGQRIPAVWYCHVHAGCIDTNALLVQFYGFPNHGGAGFLTRQSIPQNQWTHIRMEMNNDAKFLSFEASGAVSFKQGSSWPGMNALEQFQNVIVYASDPWYTPGAGNLKNFQIKALPAYIPPKLPVGFLEGTTGRIRMGSLIGRFTIPQSFVVQFDVFPIPGANEDWRNLLLMTAGYSTWGPYHRYPGIWFCHVHAGCPQGT